MKIGIIGGGASGMMAAGTISGDHEIMLLERNEKLGKKLFITGKGRCNITNDVPNNEFMENIVSNGKFMFGSLNSFSPSACIDFFRDRGLELKVERGGRVFPKSDKSSDVIKILEKHVKNNNVNVVLNCKALKVSKVDEKFIVETTLGNYTFDSLIISCGGKSYPMTGSSGEYHLAQGLGHSIVKPVAALVPILLKSDVQELMGVSLKNVRLDIVKNNKTVCSKFGEMMFTDKGITGPIVLFLSSFINRIELSGAIARIDLKPNLDIETLDNRILRDFGDFVNKQLKNSLGELLIKKLIPLVIERSKIPEWKSINSVTKQERASLVNTIKNLDFEIEGLDSIDRAIVTSGGVATSEISPKNMQSKLVKNLYFCGEMIDVDGVTGGYNIQIALSTGYLAGASIGKEN